MPAAVAAVLFALVVSGSAQANTPIKAVHGSGLAQSSDPWTGPASIVYAQNPDFGGAYASQNDNVNGNGNFATSYDNFTLSASTSLSSVEWVGSYFNPPTQGTITAWTLNIYSNNGGIPGTSLYQTVVSGNGSETFLQNDNIGDPTFLYTLPVNFSATAGTEYWISVVPDLSFPPQWGWETGTGGDGAAYQCFLGSCGAVPNDLAFALFGGTSTTPEPGTLILLGSGILGLAGTLRRKIF
jgi:hypothetical protein